VGYWYVSIPYSPVNIDEELSDVRVLLEKCSQGQNVDCDFILVLEKNIENKEICQTKFNKMKNHLPENVKKSFTFHLIDPNELEKWEKDLGIKV